MQVLRQCCELCFAPNTVSRFVRIFPRAALFFLVLHIVILIITGKKFSSVNINILTYSAPVYVFVNIHNKNSVPKLHCTFIDLLKQKKVCQLKESVCETAWLMMHFIIFMPVNASVSAPIDCICMKNQTKFRTSICSSVYCTLPRNIKNRGADGSSNFNKIEIWTTKIFLIFPIDFNVWFYFSASNIVQDLLLVC